MKNHPVPLGAILISDLDTLRVVADPLRNQILEILIGRPHTVREVAEKLGLGTAKLYYHINLLEKHNLIRITETRLVGNLLEKVYQAVADKLEVESSLLTFTTEEGKDNVNTVVLSMLDTTREDMIRSLQARTFELAQGAAPHPRRMVINRVLSKLSESQAEDLQDRLCALLQEFTEADQKEASEDTHQYALTVALYPTFYYPKEH
ncbi:MAG TPA: winged helix-turn-helix domain-containing protein [Anaerolineales bacterium]|nr:winged helix-turn-helix domain-containing protein [Anaerolineales bacterium]